jgi:hypothetical protein
MIVDYQYFSGAENCEGARFGSLGCFSDRRGAG